MIFIDAVGGCKKPEDIVLTLRAGELIEILKRYDPDERVYTRLDCDSFGELNHNMIFDDHDEKEA